MAYRPDHVLYSMFPIYLVVTLFYLIIIKLIHKYKKTHAIYNRSYLLLIFSAVFGYTEIIISILLGVLILQEGNSKSPEILTLILIVTLVNESYFFSTFLTVYRVVNLIKLNNGLFNTKNSIFIRSRLKNSWNLKAILIYGTLSIIPRTVNCILYKSGYLESRKYDEVDLIIMTIQLFTDGAFYFICIIYVIKSNCDVTLRIQYSLYAVAWTGAYIVINHDEIVIFLLIIPIRNIAMELISIASIYEHEKHYILPLPEIIDLDFILRSEFFVTKFRELFYLFSTKSREQEFNILLSICIYKQTKSEAEKANIESQVRIYQKAMNKSLSLGESELEFDLDLIYTELYIEFDSRFLQDFIKTPEFEAMKIEYSSS